MCGLYTNVRQPVLRNEVSTPKPCREGVVVSLYMYSRLPCGTISSDTEIKLPVESLILVDSIVPFSALTLLIVWQERYFGLQKPSIYIPKGSSLRDLVPPGVTRENKANQKRNVGLYAW